MNNKKHKILFFILALTFVFNSFAFNTLAADEGIFRYIMSTFE